MDISNILRKYLLLEEYYRGVHLAPDSRDCPMYDLSQSYGDDIYGPDAYRYYGHSSEYSRECLPIIQDCRNNPNKKVRIYRAVPKINDEIEKEISNLVYQYDYMRKFKFFPKGSNFTDLYYKYYHEDKETADSKILEVINNEITALNSRKLPDLEINKGDWVTISLAYAKAHGLSHLNNKYKVLKKTVKASELFTDANDLAEWGYN